jgi:Asp-tRNA(Asn)/Glu-tRNA(Gln) amidotransferase A subunit family amidase
MENPAELPRRAFFALCASIGITHPVFAEALWRSRGPRVGNLPGPSNGAPGAMPGSDPITRDDVAAAAKAIGLEFTDAERDMLVEDLNGSLPAITAIHGVSLGNDVPPAIRFDPEAPGLENVPARTIRVRLVDEPRARRNRPRPARSEDLAFMSVAGLGELVRARKVTSTELVRLSLDRLRRHDPTLQCVVTLTEDRALEQAERADREIKAGKYRGPLHGIPWGAKDLFAVPGYPTTWGSPVFKNQVLDTTATVVKRLDAAGAVLVAKLTLGELAMGDVWFGGTTKNPWKTDQGSSGSSAGSASATAAGLVPFALGTETLGSIVSPSTRCGVTGLRPTFGRVSRYGAMSLCPTMDKVGPICRTAEDCGLVLRAIHGADGLDPTAVDRPLGSARSRKLGKLRVGYLRSAFEADHATKAFDDAALAVLRKLELDLVPVDMELDLPVAALRLILSAEAAASFDELTRSGQDDQMVRQVRGAWPGSFRAARFISAVDYLNANRIRTLLMRRMDRAMRDVDLFVTPSFGGNVLLVTNLTGHPTLVLPNGFNPDRTPVSLSFVGRLFGEADLVAVGEAYQDATSFHLERPAGFS